MSSWCGECPPKDSKIWRYLDFVKLTSLLDKEALYFPRADLLGDPFEGSISKMNIKKRGQSTDFSEHYKWFRKLTVINSWHLNEFESDAMWKLYSGEGQGIAIQSTVGHLKNSLKKYKRDKIYMYKVKYVDYDDYWMAEHNLAIFFYKRKSFQHENEFRAVIQKVSLIDPVNCIPLDKMPFKDGGLYVPVDLEKLIEKVYLSPTCPDWQRELIQSTLNKYGINKKVWHSRLRDEPIF